MSPKFLLEIITPDRLAYHDEVKMVTAPSASGIVGILAHHVPLFSQLVEGEIKITKDNSEYFLAIGGGFMEVTKERVSVLVSRAVHAHELNEAEIKRARARAQEALRHPAAAAELAQAQSLLRRSILEMKVLRRHRPGVTS